MPRAPGCDISPEDAAARQQRAFGPLRVYPTREQALARFRPIPDQLVLPYIAEHVAATSIRPVEGGWTWKFDPLIFVRDQFTPTLLTRLDCRVEIPVTRHHIMLGQPIALVSALRTLLADWDHSLPHG